MGEYHPVTMVIVGWRCVNCGKEYPAQPKPGYCSNCSDPYARAEGKEGKRSSPIVPIFKA
jgi:hypothetical protein